MITKSISWKKMETVQGIFFFREVISFLALFNKSEQKKNLKFYSIIDKYERFFLNWPFFLFLEWYKAVFSSTKKFFKNFWNVRSKYWESAILNIIGFFVVFVLIFILITIWFLILDSSTPHLHPDFSFFILVMVIRLDKIRSPVAFFFFPLDLDPDSSSSFIQLDLCH